MAGHSKPLTPLRYPGGKGAFAPYLRAIINENNLHGGHYIEPFAGGAAIAFDLLFNKFCSHIHINDIDPAIYCFWISAIKNSQCLIEKIEKTPVNIDEWHKQKSILEQLNNHSELDVGFATFFLNRTNRSGILKGGVIGGKNQNGNYKIDARFNKSNLCRRIEKIAQYKNQINIYNLDAIDLIKNSESMAPEKSLMYLDPPYYKKGQGLYRNYYTHDDHVLIRDALKYLNLPWIVSYDNCEEIKDIYAKFRKSEYALDYCAYKKMKGSEVIILCDNILDPSTTKGV